MVPGEFVSMLLAAFDPASEQLTTPWVVVNDGGTGIRAQLERHTKRYDVNADTLPELNAAARRVPPIRLDTGFRRSDYPYEEKNEKGEVVSVSTATTWYMS
jgi:hypothetical protein